MYRANGSESRATQCQAARPYSVAPRLAHRLDRHRRLDPLFRLDAGRPVRPRRGRPIFLHALVTRAFPEAVAVRHGPNLPIIRGNCPVGPDVPETQTRMQAPADATRKARIWQRSPLLVLRERRVSRAWP